jgi:hypothetical protein
MQAERIALSALPEGYKARRFTVHVGGWSWAKNNPEGFEGVRLYKTERGARAFAERASLHFKKSCYVEESWLRTAGWWVGGLHGEGLPGPMPAPGQTWTLVGWELYGKRPIRCRVLSVDDDRGVRIYVGTRRWYDGAPGTLRVSARQLRQGWYYGRRPGVIQVAPVEPG